MRMIRAVLIGLVVAGVAVGTYWYFNVRPRLKSISGEFDQPEPSRPKSLHVTRNDSADADFDLTIDLEANPIGIAANERGLLLCNREDPWGFLRVRNPEADTYEMSKLAVIEPDYGQKISLDTVTWNGSHYVAVTTAAWFEQKEGNVFTVHDPETLAVKDYHPAPDRIGCLAWDGSGYWAATRANTADSDEPAFLYRLDRNFKVIDKHPPPDIGCQGLAWDGSYLWFVDVFSDSIHVVNTEITPPEVVYSHSTSLNYLSGIAFDGRSIWISEYDDNRLHRLRSSRRAQWTGARAPEATTAEALPQEDRKTRDVYTNRFPKTGDEDMDVLELVAELRHDTLIGSWRIYFGPELFAGNTPSDSAISIPTFVRYTVNVEGGTLNQPVQLQLDGQPGENTSSEEQLATGLGPGTYSVYIFLHAQYVDREGTNRILNSSSPSVEVTLQ